MSSTAPAAVQPVPRGGLGKLVGHRLIDWLPAVIVLVGIVGMWQGLFVWIDVQKLLLPKQTAIASAFWTDRQGQLNAGWLTFQDAAGGFGLGPGASSELLMEFRCL